MQPEDRLQAFTPTPEIIGSVRNQNYKESIIQKCSSEVSTCDTISDIVQIESDSSQKMNMNTNVKQMLISEKKVSCLDIPKTKLAFLEKVRVDTIKKNIFEIFSDKTPFKGRQTKFSYKNERTLDQKEVLETKVKKMFFLQKRNMTKNNKQELIIKTDSLYTMKNKNQKSGSETNLNIKNIKWDLSRTNNGSENEIQKPITKTELACSKSKELVPFQKLDLNEIPKLILKTPVHEKPLCSNMQSPHLEEPILHNNLELRQKRSSETLSCSNISALPQLSDDQPNSTKSTNKLLPVLDYDKPSCSYKYLNLDQFPVYPKLEPEPSTSLCSLLVDSDNLTDELSYLYETSLRIPVLETVNSVDKFQPRLDENVEEDGEKDLLTMLLEASK